MTVRAPPWFLLAACAASSQPVAAVPDPDFVLLEHAIEPGMCEAKMRLYFVMKNTRQTPLRIDRYEANVVQNGSPLSTHAGELALILQSQDEASFDVSVPIPRGACKQPSAMPASLSTGGTDRIDVKGRLFAVSGDEVVFEFEDFETLQAERRLELQAELRGQRYDRGRVELYAVFQLYNPNGYGVSVEDVSFKVRLDGRVVAESRTFEKERLRDLARASREVPLDINADDPAIATLIKLGKIPYDIETTLHIGETEHVQTERGEFSF